MKPAEIATPTAVAARPVASIAALWLASSVLLGQQAIAWRSALSQPADWYAGAEARRIADQVLLFQRDSGGWPKNLDMAARLSVEEQAAIRAERARADSTIDNGATVRPLAFLARVRAASPEERYRLAFLRGLDFLFAAQYPNGGWPQFHPDATGYQRHITFNDGAMVNVLEILNHVANAKPPYGFVEATRRERARHAVDRGVQCILDCQVRVGGERTAWCAQHDSKTLAPAAARSYEKISLSGAESVGVLRFLMGLPDPDPAVVEAVESAVAWLQRVKLTGIRQDRRADPSLPRGYDKVIVEDAEAPPLWARFYEIGTNRPIFSGRDGVVKYRLADIEVERRTGYAWYTDAPRGLLEREYPAWRRRQAAVGEGTNAYARWPRGPSSSRSFFPVAVWLQDPRNAERYRAAGFNLYVGLWRGPTEQQLELLRDAGMRVICHQNETGLRNAEDPVIVGWMHGDEPDNAQPRRNGDGEGYGPPVAPERIVADYRQLKRRDPSRPVLLNLGQGVAWDQWHGRGVRTNHPEDYPEYVRGCDIASFDIYPAVHPSSEVAGNLWYVARGVERLRRWTREDQIVWNCIECTRIQHPERKATPAQVKAEVWMSIIHGSTGLIYFVHEWQPRFNESALLDDPEMLAAVSAVNQRIADLAPVLNSAAVAPGPTVRTSDPNVPVAAMLKQHGAEYYLFAVAMRGQAVSAEFSLPANGGGDVAEVLDEDRRLTLNAGGFRDDFAPWGVHLYRILRKPD